MKNLTWPHGERPVEQVALRLRAAGRAQHVDLILRLDTFGRGHHVEAARQIDDGGDDRCAFVVGRHFRDECPVDLDLVEREHPQIGQRRISCAEIVEHDGYADLLQLTQRGDRFGVVAQQRGFCQFDLQPVR